MHNTTGTNVKITHRDPRTRFIFQGKAVVLFKVPWRREDHVVLVLEGRQAPNDIRMALGKWREADGLDPPAKGKVNEHLMYRTYGKKFNFSS